MEVSVSLFVLSFSFWRIAVSRKKLILKANDSTDVAVPCDDCTDEKLLGTVKSYDRHVIICDENSSWPKHIEKIAEFPFNLIDCIDEVKTISSIKLKITAANLLFENSNRNRKILVYPDNLLIAFDDSNIEILSSILLSSDDLNKNKQLFENFTVTKPPWKTLILVCIHEARDKRCKRAGTQVIEELNKSLTQRGVNTEEIKVSGSSHIGGHEFAGVLIVYPSGDWYGKVTKNTVTKLLDSIQSKKIFKKCWRGKTKSKLLNW
jgi:hypothetical protein